MGVVSLIFWALMLMVSVKYVQLVLRADNDGEGGILALLSLVEGDRLIAGLRHLPADDPGHPRRGAAVWRRGDHAGDLGAVGDGGAEARRPRLCSRSSCR